jgi:hypothetical protein
MGLWQLRWLVCCGRVERVEVLALRCCGYAVRIGLRAGQAHQLQRPFGGAMWHSLPALKGVLRSCGVRQILLLQPECHDEIIGRPLLQGADPGLPVQLD